MEIIGYFAAALVGISLGLMGGGGSILTVPLLVYFFEVNPVTATSYSLFIVGITSLVGAYRYFRKGQVNIKVALLFGASSVLTVFLTRIILIPVIPESIIRIGTFTLTHDVATMVLFALLMLWAAVSMIKNANGKNVVSASSPVPSTSVIILLMYGVAIGIITGLLGAGGGFLLIPALVLLVRMPMKHAVGTSLFIIAMNSLIGFTGDLNHFDINWPLLSIISIIAIAGIFAGMAIGKTVKPARLKKWFGYFAL